MTKRSNWILLLICSFVIAFALSTNNVKAEDPTPTPEVSPSVEPTAAPTEVPTAAPTAVPTAVPVEEEEEEDDSDDDEDEEYWKSLFVPVVNFQATKIDKTSVNLKWDKREDVDGYCIEYKKASASKWTLIYVKSDSSVKYTVKKLEPNTKYTFRIKTYIYYGDDPRYFDLIADDDDEDDPSDASDDADVDDDDEEFPDFDYGRYATMNLKTLTKSGEGAKTAVSDTYEYKAPAKIKKPTLKRAKSTKARTVRLTWKSKSKVSGFEIFCSQKRGSKYRKAKVVKSGKKVACMIKKLVSKKTYYFKIRSYVKVKGKKAYTGFSKVKKAKIK